MSMTIIQMPCNPGNYTAKRMTARNTTPCRIAETWRWKTANITRKTVCCICATVIPGTLCITR